MRKLRYVQLALIALIAAGALLAFGCKQPEGGGQGGQGGSGQGSGQAQGGQNQGGGQGQNPSGSTDNKGKTEVFTNALQFEGIIGESDSQEADKRIRTDYVVSVTISHNRVGVSAEDKYTGYLFMGSAPYDEKTGSVDVVLTDVKGVQEPLSFGATYQKASNVLKVTEFGGEERSAILPRKDEHKLYNRFKTYTVPATLPVLGESVLVFKISNQQATVAVVTGKGHIGQSNPFGSYGTLGSYHTEAFVARNGKLTAKIPLDTKDIDKAKSVLEITATVTNSGVQDVTSSILSLKKQDGEFDEHDSDHLKEAHLPHFSKTRFTFKGNTGAAGADVYYGLILEAMPVVRYQIERGKREKREMYEMRAQFVQYNADPYNPPAPPGRLTIEKTSKEVRVLGQLVSGAYNDKHNPPEFSFTFPAGCFGNTAVDRLCKSTDVANGKAVGFTITGWKPIVGEDKVLRDTEGYPIKIPETVVAGEYVLKVDTAGGVVAPDGTGAVKAVIIGAKSAAGVSGGIDGLSMGDYTAVGLDGTALIAGKKVKELFKAGEGFKRL